MARAKRKIVPRSHGDRDEHLHPGVKDEMGDWRPEDFKRAREQLAACEDCQACLFEAGGEDAGHLTEEAAHAMAQECIPRTLPLVSHHLRACADCAHRLAEADSNSEDVKLAEVLDGEFDDAGGFDYPTDGD